MTWRDYVKPTPTKSSSGTVSFDGGANVIFCIVLVWVGMALLFDFPIWDSSYIQ
jgi:hypothetical protein